MEGSFMQVLFFKNISISSASRTTESGKTGSLATVWQWRFEAAARLIEDN